MPAMDRHSSVVVEMLRPPEARATPLVAPALCYPSPPPTSTTLKRVVSLPQICSSGQSAGNWVYQRGRDHARRPDPSAHLHMVPRSPPKDPGSLLLSPPYSPPQRLPVLPHADDLKLKPALFSDSHFSTSTDVGIATDDEDVAALEDDVGHEQLADSDVEDDKSDWDEPLFMNAPRAHAARRGLRLDLFDDDFAGPSSSIDSEAQSPDSSSELPETPGLPASQSPPLRSKVPRRVTHEYEGHDEVQRTHKPLFDPSYFDVFDNDWDTLPHAPVPPSHSDITDAFAKLSISESRAEDDRSGGPHAERDDYTGGPSGGPSPSPVAEVLLPQGVDGQNTLQ